MVGGVEWLVSGVVCFFRGWKEVNLHVDCLMLVLSVFWVPLAKTPVHTGIPGNMLPGIGSDRNIFYLLVQLWILRMDSCG